MKISMMLCAATLITTAAACRTPRGVDDVSTSGMGAQPAVRLERGACFGKCARYVLEVYAGGGVRYQGRENVSLVGSAADSVTPAAVAALLDQFALAKFADADSAYVEGSPGCGQYFTDGPQTTLAAAIDTVLKTVRFDAGCTGAPRYLKQLAAQVDSVAGVKRWTNGPAENKP